MIELMKGLPAGVVGFEAIGEVTSADYELVAIPAIERALATHDKIRLLHILATSSNTTRPERCGTTRSSDYTCARSSGSRL